METPNVNKIIAFLKELAAVTLDKKVTLSEGIGLIPEGMGFIHALQNYKELQKEVEYLYDLNPEQLKKLHWIDQEHFDAVYDLFNSIANCLEEFNHAR